MIYFGFHNQTLWGVENVHELEISSCRDSISVSITLPLAQTRIRPFQLLGWVFLSFLFIVKIFLLKFNLTIAEY